MRGALTHIPRFFDTPSRATGTPDNRYNSALLWTRTAVINNRDLSFRARCTLPGARGQTKDHRHGTMTSVPSLTQTDTYSASADRKNPLGSAA